MKTCLRSYFQKKYSFKIEILAEEKLIIPSTLLNFAINQKKSLKNQKILKFCIKQKSRKKKKLKEKEDLKRSKKEKSKEKKVLEPCGFRRKKIVRSNLSRNFQAK